MWLFVKIQIQIEKANQVNNTKTNANIALQIFMEINLIKNHKMHPNSSFLGQSCTISDEKTNFWEAN